MSLTWEEAFHIVFLTPWSRSCPARSPSCSWTTLPWYRPRRRRKPGTPWAERWELYIDGVEIANCYTEETDLAALSALFREEESRKKACRVIHPTDDALPGIVAAGPAPVSGVALGLDRLQAVFRGEPGLGGVILFPFSAMIPPHSGV